MIRDRTLLTSWTLDFRVSRHFLKKPFASHFHNENETCATSVANPVPAASGEIRNAKIAKFSPLSFGILSSCREEKSIHHHRGGPPFFLFRVWGSMVYTLLSGPMVYTLFPCFPRKMVYTIVFLLCDLGVGRQTEKRGVPRWWCIPLGTKSLHSKFRWAFKMHVM